MASLLRRSELGTEQAPGRQPPPYVLSSHQVIPRFKLQSSEPFRDTGDVIMTLLGGRKCQNNVSPRFGNEYGWMVIVTGWYLQHYNTTRAISQKVWYEGIYCWYVGTDLVFWDLDADVEELTVCLYIGVVAAGDLVLAREGRVRQVVGTQVGRPHLAPH